MFIFLRIERTNVEETRKTIMERIKFKAGIFWESNEDIAGVEEMTRNKGNNGFERIEKIKIYALFELFIMRKGGVVQELEVRIINILRIVRRISALSFDRSSSDVKRYEQIFENVLFFPLYNISFFDIGLFSSYILL